MFRLHIGMKMFFLKIQIWKTLNWSHLMDRTRQDWERRCGRCRQIWKSRESSRSNRHMSISCPANGSGAAVEYFGDKLGSRWRRWEWRWPDHEWRSCGTMHRDRRWCWTLEFRSGTGRCSGMTRRILEPVMIERLNSYISRKKTSKSNYQMSQSINQSADQSINQSIGRSINQSINRLINQLSQSINQSNDRCATKNLFCRQQIPSSTKVFCLLCFHWSVSAKRSQNFPVYFGSW